MASLSSTLATNAKNKGGRKTADCWSQFTNIDNDIDLAVFKKRNHANCKWCGNSVSFNGKPDRVEVNNL